MKTMSRLGRARLIFCFSASAAVFGPSMFDAPGGARLLGRGGQPPEPRISIDLARHYFPSPAAEASARTELTAALGALAQFKGKIHSGSDLLAALRANDVALRLMNRHYVYVKLLCAMDRTSGACGEGDRLEADTNAAGAFLPSELLRLSDSELRAFYHEEPALAQYRYAIDQVRRDATHTLADAEESLLGRLLPEIADWQYSLFDDIVSRIAFGTVQSAAGPLDVARQRNLIASNPDGRVREEGFKKRLAGFASQRDLLAFAMIHTALAQNALAKAHAYPDAPARKYESLGFSPAETRELLQRMAQAGDVEKRYEAIRSDDIERQYHRTPHVWDMSAPAPGLVLPRHSVTDARALLHRALAGLGEEYQHAFDRLLDPASGRADILPGGAAHRYAGGFSVGFSGTPSALFIGRYDGTFKDLSVMAHEGGHATHRALMEANGVSPRYAVGPNFLFESFAAFNELLLADDMAEHADNPDLRRYYREQWLNIKGLDAFDGAKDAILEQSIYDGVAAGNVRTADDLDKLTDHVDGQFSIFQSQSPELRTRWATMSLAFEDPLYLVNYAYGGLLALKYYDLYTTNRADFAPRYVALLKHGFDATPAELLQRFLHISLADRALLTDGLSVLGSRFNQLEHSTSIKR